MGNTHSVLVGVAGEYFVKAEQPDGIEIAAVHDPLRTSVVPLASFLIHWELPVTPLSASPAREGMSRGDLQGFGKLRGNAGRKF
jgi:hypothetical protein